MPGIGFRIMRKIIVFGKNFVLINDFYSLKALTRGTRLLRAEPSDNIWVSGSPKVLVLRYHALQGKRCASYVSAITRWVCPSTHLQISARLVQYPCPRRLHETALLLSNLNRILHFSSHPSMLWGRGGLGVLAPCIILLYIPS